MVSVSHLEESAFAVARTPRGIPLPRLAALRRQAGLSQVQLATKAKLSRKTICRLEQGANARYDTIAHLAVALRISRKQLIGLPGAEVLRGYKEADAE